MDGLNKAFNLPSQIVKATIEKPEIKQAAEIIIPAKPEPPNEKDIDFKEARGNMKRLLLSGEEALDGILDLARSSEHPRSYEVAGQLIKTLADVNKDLMNIHKLSKEHDNTGKSLDGPKTITNNAVFVGTTAELQQMRKAMKEQ